MLSPLERDATGSCEVDAPERIFALSTATVAACSPIDVGTVSAGFSVAAAVVAAGAASTLISSDVSTRSERI